MAQAAIVCTANRLKKSAAYRFIDSSLQVHNRTRRLLGKGCAIHSKKEDNPLQMPLNDAVCLRRDVCVRLIQYNIMSFKRFPTVNRFSNSSQKKKKKK